MTKKKQLTIPLPNASALLLNSAATAFIAAREIRERSGIDKTLHSEVSFPSDEEAFDYIEKMIESIVLSFTALEAFVNETIPADYFYARHRRSEVVLEAVNKKTVERHTPIDEKLTIVLPEVLKCSSPKGARCWQGYKQLKSVRDRIIHMKTEDRRSSGVEIDSIWKAIILAPAPHFAAKAVIDHFVSTMKEKPAWHRRFPHSTP
ncbi:hypothetical protein C6Y56_21525 [Pseudomonas fluorescens]|uniref:Cthe-2314-like HEPN domain-containing protein n=2 Tax=Pseudomonas TaxID=286 RepID=A0A7Z3C7H9_PSEFL|nr:hypothetical protein C6Y56_21525 [Pseudomonas fluorescens]